MANMPNEPEAFAEQVATMLHRLQPEFVVDHTGPAELIVNGRRLDLENLYRMVAQDPPRGTEIVEHYLDQLFSAETLSLTELALDFARPRIMPRIQPTTIFNHLSQDLVAHIPYVNDTVVVFVTDMPNMTISLTTEQMIKWRLTIDDLEQIARENLDQYSPELEIQFVESREGGRAAILSEQDGYDAARLLMSGLFNRLAPQLGGDFYVATPARDMFVALSVGPDDFLGRLRERVEHDYGRLPYPITKELFYVTRDGVAGTTGTLAA